MSQTDETKQDMAELTSGADLVMAVCGKDTYLLPVDTLTANSQFFARALEVPMLEKEERKVVIKDIEGSIFEKVVKYILDGSFQFDVETEACEALEAADRLDMKELKEEVCKHIKDNLDPENVKAVASLAERFNAKQLFTAALKFIRDKEVELEKEDVERNPSLAVALVKECRKQLTTLKKRLCEKEEELDEKEEELDEKRQELDDLMGEIDEKNQMIEERRMEMTVEWSI